MADTEPRPRVDSMTMTYVRAYAAAVEESRKADDARKAARARLEQVLAGRTELYGIGTRPVVRVIVSDVRRVDVKALKEKEPELADRFTIVTTSERVVLDLDQA